MPTAASLISPTADRYVAAFRAIVKNMGDHHFQMLRVHYHAPEQTITAKRLAALMGYRNYAAVNAQYGRLARLVGEQLDYNPEPERLGTLVLFEKRQGEWHWQMRPEVAKALEQLGWVEVPLPEEITPTPVPLVEGASCRVLVNAYERNPEARRRCLEAHGTRCCICGFSFGAVYGEVAEGYIHVHHLRPLSEIDGEYVVDPVADLRPVCPNCHAVIHRRTPPFSIEEVRAFLRSRSPA
jgi:5-methylcytosine-specific restriction protein A